MRFKPSDETSLRHLFSSAYAEEVLRLSYIGPVLNSAGAIEPSPDAMILDMRRHPYAPLRCEFKYEPSGPQDFAHNGVFDIAIVWSLRLAASRDKLSAGLLSQNRCSELVALDERKAFRDLPVYSPDSLSRLGGADILRDIALNMECESVFALCIAAQMYPEKFRMDRMTEFLSLRFARVNKMQRKGRQNVVTASMQTKPPFLVRMHGRFYRWTREFDSHTAAQELMQLMRSNFLQEPPSKEDLDAVRG